MPDDKNDQNNKVTVPLPPADANVHTTACDYCIVGCGYKVYTWPHGTQGGVTAKENALGVDFPTDELSGQWLSPNAIAIALSMVENTMSLSLLTRT